MLARPAHTLTAVVTLAIGIGANVAMFAVVDGVLLAPLDYRDADQLVAVAETKQGEDPVNMGYLSFVDLKSQARSVSHLVAATQSTATFSGGGQDAERVNAMRVSRGYFDMVGVQPRLGRAFTDAEDMPGAARRVVILSDGLWRRRFAADPGVIGRPVDHQRHPPRDRRGDAGRLRRHRRQPLLQGRRAVVPARLRPGGELRLPDLPAPAGAGTTRARRHAGGRRGRAHPAVRADGRRRARAPTRARARA